MALRSLGNAPIIESAGEQTNPSDADVIADTGALAAGIYEVRVTVGASAAADVALERRNAANSGNVGDVPVIKVPAGQTCQYVFTYKLELSERLRVIMDDALTGTIAATLNVEAYQ